MASVDLVPIKSEDLRGKADPSRRRGRATGVWGAIPEITYGMGRSQKNKLAKQKLYRSKP